MCIRDRPASPNAIALGFACGSMVSFTPLLGLHFILAIVFAYLIRGNLIAALLGTIVGNPITFPFIWGMIYKVGAFFTSTKLSLISFLLIAQLDPPAIVIKVFPFSTHLLILSICFLPN